MIYDVLLQVGLYLEADAAYKQFNLHRYASPVPESSLEGQRNIIKNTYLQFPIDDVQIIVVDTVANLQFAADTIGVSLETPKLLENNSFEDNSVVNSKVNPKREKKNHSINNNNSTNNTTNNTTNNNSKKGDDGTVNSKIVTANLSISEVLQDIDTVNVNNTVNKKYNKYKNIVGLDSEWKVTMYHNTVADGASILQIAVVDYVFIIDFRALTKPVKGKRSGIVNTIYSIYQFKILLLIL